MITTALADDAIPSNRSNEGTPVDRYLLVYYVGFTQNGVSGNREGPWTGSVATLVDGTVAACGYNFWHEDTLVMEFYNEHLLSPQKYYFRTTDDNNASGLGYPACMIMQLDRI